MTLKRIDEIRAGEPRSEAEIFELCDLAEVGLKKRQQTRDSVAKVRSMRQGNEKKLRSTGPLTPTPKSAPLPTQMPAMAPVAGPLDDLLSIDLPQAPIVGLDPGFKDPTLVAFDGDSITVLDPEFEEAF